MLNKINVKKKKKELKLVIWLIFKHTVAVDMYINNEQQPWQGRNSVWSHQRAGVQSGLLTPPACE